MSKIFEALSSGIIRLPIFFIFLLLLCCIFFYFFKESINNRIKKKPKNVKKIKDLEFHRFFNVCESVNKRVGLMSFTTHGDYDETKTILMRLLINLKCEVMIKEFRKLLNNKNIDVWGVYELQHEFKFTLNKVVETYNDLAYKRFIKYGISEEDSLYLIENYEDYRSVMIEGFIDSLDSVLMNSDFNNNFDKVNTLMELCTLAIHVIPRDVRSAFEFVNGRYAKYNNKLDGVI